MEFLTRSVAIALLDHCGVQKPPVPIRKLILSPPRDLATDLSLVENPHITFCSAQWIRLIGGQGVMFVNGNLAEPERRYAMACALFSALCFTPGGQASGLQALAQSESYACDERFARYLLMPIELLPNDWHLMSVEALADLFGVPLEVAATRLQEIKSMLDQSPSSASSA